MSPEAINRILREGLVLILQLSAGPIQATTQIQEQTLSYVPKLTGVFVTVAIMGPWILAQAVKFTVALLESIPMVR